MGYVVPVGDADPDRDSLSSPKHLRALVESFIALVSIAAIVLSVLALRASQDANRLVEQQLASERRPLLLARAHLDEADYPVIDIVNESTGRFANDLDVEFITFLEFSASSSAGTASSSLSGGLIPVFGWFSGLESFTDTARPGTIATVHLDDYGRTELVTWDGYLAWLDQANQVASAESWPWNPRHVRWVLRVTYVDSDGDHVAQYFWGDLTEQRPVSREIGDIMFNLHQALLESGLVPHIALNRGYPGFDELLQMLESVTASHDYQEACRRIEALGERPNFCWLDL